MKTFLSLVARDLLQRFGTNLHDVTIEGEGLIENARKVGEHLMEEIDKLTSEANNSLTRQLVNSSTIKEVRGRGLMIGIELDRNSRNIKAAKTLPKSLNESDSGFTT